MHLHQEGIDNFVQRAVVLAGSSSRSSSRGQLRLPVAVGEFTCQFSTSATRLREHEQCIGFTEVQLVVQVKMIDGMKKLIALEEELAANFLEEEIVAAAGGD